MGSMKTRIKETIGRRGLLLALSGLAWTLLGMQMLTNPRIRFSNGQDVGTLFLKIMDSPLWGWMWIVCGVLAVVVGLCRNCRPFCGHDEHGFTLIVLPVFVTTIFYGCSWAFNAISDGLYGRAESVYGLVVWGLVSGVLLIVSGWPEIDGLPRIGEERADEEVTQTGRHRKTT